ncbi:MAG: 50S ribosomal protein L24 [Candidatus Saccharimonadales bacterium]
MKLRKGDKVLVLAGKDKGKTGEISKVLLELNQVVVDGINIQKRAQKPTPQNPKGEIAEKAMPIDVSNVGIVHPEKKNKASRVGYKVDKEGNKVRIYKATGKEIK